MKVYVLLNRHRVLCEAGTNVPELYYMHFLHACESLCEFHGLHIQAVLQKPHVAAVLFDLLASFALPVSWNLPN